MKKLAYSIAILLAACACTKEEVTEMNNPSAVAITFTATMESNTDTKSLLGEDSSILWSKTDSISVLDVNSSPANSKFILESGEGTTTATFSGSCPSSSTGYFAVYPYNKADSLSGTNEITVHWDGADQKAVKSFSTTTDDGVLDTYFPQGSPMIAYGAAPEAGIHDVSLSFKNVCSYLKLTLATKVAGITIKANTDTDVIAAEDVTISWNDDTPTVTAVSNGSSEIHLTGSAGGSLEPGVYYIAILPGSLTSGITMTLISSVDSGESGIWTKTGSSQSTLARGKVYNLGSFVVPSWIKLAGSGTESDPYLIEDYTDFQIMEASVAYGLSNYNTAFYKQTVDIDFEGKSLNPIGNAEHPFSGTYDGNSKTISNEQIVNPIIYTGTYGWHRYACGLFGAIKDATIHDLTVQDPVFPVPANNHFSFSPFVGVAYSSNNGTNILTNCKCLTTTPMTFTSPISAGGNGEGVGIMYGGFIADSQSNVRITECTSQMDLTVQPKAYYVRLYIGGFIGYAQGLNSKSGEFLDDNGIVTLDCCRNLGSLSAGDTSDDSKVLTYVAGFIAEAAEIKKESVIHDVVCRITNCVNSGNITSTANIASAYAAGILADMDYRCFHEYIPYFVNCINSGNISASNSVADNEGAWSSGIMANYDHPLFLKTDYLTLINVCANCGTITGGVTNPFITEGDPRVTNCWDTYQPSANYKGETTANWNYTSHNSEVVNIMNAYLTSEGVTGLYKSWKVNEDGKLDLDF